MRTDEKLDLCGFIKPYCLLQCKSVLASMKPGSILEIRVRDPETYSDLLTILERSGETVLSRRRTKKDYLLRVRKDREGRDELSTEEDF
jgi:TusA-related sulfurtransferase